MPKRHCPSILLVSSWEQAEGRPITARVKSPPVATPHKKTSKPKRSKRVKAKKAPQDLRGQVLHDGLRAKKEMPYREYLLTKHWRIVRKKAIELAQARCATCGSPRRLVVHHITYDNLWHEYANDVIVLCDTCHNILHGQYIYPV